MAICQCGCGQQIKHRKNHKYTGVPRFISGHSSKGKHLSEETRKKIGDIHRGRKLSEETKKKLSVSNKNPSEEIRRKIGDFHKGKHLSEEHKKKISESNLGKHGTVQWITGDKNNPALSYSSDWRESLKESIRQRDNHTCRLCGKVWEPGTKAFHAHHIDYDKKHCEPKNLITLCNSCHTKTNSNREHWIECFRNLDSVFR